MKMTSKTWELIFYIITFLGMTGVCIYAIVACILEIIIGNIFAPIVLIIVCLWCIGINGYFVFNTLKKELKK